MAHDTTTTPFTLDIPISELDDLRARLAATRWPHELPDVGWSHGAPVGYLRDLADYWATDYDWREHEARINAVPQFTTQIDGQRVHFAHVRSPEPGAVPLVVTHGWPSSLVEFLDVVGPLTDPRAHGGDPADAFHLVLPTLPGFTLSGPTHQPGDGSTDRYAEVVAELMHRLGYERYGAQGGDVGSFVSPQLARLHPDRIIGVHMNDPLTIPSWEGGAESWDADGAGDSGWDASGDEAAWAEGGQGERAGSPGYPTDDDAKLAALNDWGSERTGYAAIQSTRPQSLATGLTDSPAGLLAWLVDVFHLYTNPGIDRPDEAVGRDALLTNATLYWLTGTIGSSMRLYRESDAWGVSQPKSGVPTGCALFPGNLTVRSLAEAEHEVVHWTEFDRGGHFAGLEAPDLLTADVRAFFRTLR